MSKQSRIITHHTAGYREIKGAKLFRSIRREVAKNGREICGTEIDITRCAEIASS